MKKPRTYTPFCSNCDQYYDPTSPLLDCLNQCKKRGFEPTDRNQKDRYLIDITSNPLRSAYPASSFDDAFEIRSVLCDAHHIDHDTYEIMEHLHSGDFLVVKVNDFNHDLEDLHHLAWIKA